ncbi:MAG: ATP synthase subunit I [Proteobacteria bacterium]|nr:ATP synthase subunit I [Pseudomonadota bacterium]
MELRGVASARVLCVAQLLTTALAVAFVGLAWGGAAALAALFGGLIAILPAAYFALKVAALGPVAEASRVLRTFYRAEAMKLLLTAVLFALGARWFGEHFAPLMLTCVACLAMNWVVLVVTTHKKA